MDTLQQGQRLKEWRLNEKNWSQETLAAEIGTSKFHVSRWEHGKHRIGPMAKKALNQLGFSI